MASNILATVRQIKSNVAEHLEAAAIEALCRELKHVWRERLLGPVMTVHAFLLQVLHGNVACDQVPHLVHASFDGNAYIQARLRLRPSLQITEGHCRAIGCRQALNFLVQGMAQQVGRSVLALGLGYNLIQRQRAPAQSHCPRA